MMKGTHRYVIVGSTCAALHNAIMIGCDFLGIHYLISSMISYVIVVLCGYALHSRFTFEQSPSASSLFRYAAGMATNYPGSIVLMFVFCGLASQPVWVAAPLTTLLLFLWNFVTSRWAIVGTTRVKSDCRTDDGRSLAKP